MSLLGRIFSQDELRLTVRPAIKVLCLGCRQHIYYMRKEDGGVGLDNLVPPEGGPAPSHYGCPRCGRTFVAFSPSPTLFTDRGYITQ